MFSYSLIAGSISQKVSILIGAGSIDWSVSVVRSILSLIPRISNSPWRHSKSFVCFHRTTAQLERILDRYSAYRPHTVYSACLNQALRSLQVVFTSDQLVLKMSLGKTTKTVTQYYFRTLRACQTPGLAHALNNRRFTPFPSPWSLQPLRTRSPGRPSSLSSLPKLRDI